MKESLDFILEDRLSDIKHTLPAVTLRFDRDDLY